MTIPTWFVVAMGLGTVFIGLICIIILCKILGAVCTIIEGNSKQSYAPAPAATPASTPAPAPAQSSVNRQEVIAAIGVAVAEELDVDVNAIRITSIKRI